MKHIFIGTLILTTFWAAIEGDQCAAVLKNVLEQVQNLENTIKSLIEGPSKYYDTKYIFKINTEKLNVLF